MFLTELDREVDRSRRALEQVPAGHYDWKPHEKSMAFGYLADSVRTAFVIRFSLTFGKF